MIFCTYQGLDWKLREVLVDLPLKGQGKKWVCTHMMQVIEICGCKRDIWSISKSYKRMNIAPVKLIYIIKTASV